MIGLVAENVPQTGALGMSLLGGIGMFSVSMWNPVIGSWIDEARTEALAVSQTPEAAELISGQATLANLSLFPLSLIFAFAALYFYMGKRTSKPVN